MERQPRRLSRSRALIAGLTIAVADLACNTVAAPASHEPTRQPESTPSNTPSLVVPTNTPESTPAVTPETTPSPVVTAEPKPHSPEPTLSPLERNRQDWRGGVTEGNPSTGRFITPDGKTVRFGRDTYKDLSHDGEYFYTGRIVGAEIGENGHIIAIIGMEDGTDESNNFDVAFRLGNRMMVKETTSRYDNLELGEEISSSKEFYDKVLDGSYLNRLIKFIQPFKSDNYKKGLFPVNFPGLVSVVDKNVTASSDLYNFTLTIEGTDYRTVDNPDFVNIDLTDPKSIDIESLPFFFEAAVNTSI